jgi:hypothetical protein
MKYFFDTEFIEGFNKPLFGKPRHFIDLISIGIVAEDGREYYAISNEYNYKDASDWVKNNVIIPMYTQEIHGDKRNHIGANNFHRCIPNGKSISTISFEVKEFCGSSPVKEFAEKDIQFYGYYADYDWVLLCSLFGRMINLPHGFPMYCKDLKQMLDEKADELNWLYGRDIWSNSNRSVNTIGKGQSQEKDRPATLEEKIKTIKELTEYPTQENEHNALDDAKWNKQLYEFIKNLK